ncbi:hypothetical protein GCM10022631_11640 [Deinococcus rubellus]|uniref:AlgX/AlgJ SGNH hydrolase-like domain-containing protein n=1 Tax=Deinococcus rubellus TaxID=1889240 RepID=A0ABY5YDJ6_9DEIO|nr:hypothetical protein [Deinococcus rubellus]UWX62791.1 hypothetical protein N0D28_08390 [Deinococcus rubellus]
MKQILLTLALLGTIASAARPDCGDFADRSKFYFDNQGNILSRFDVGTLTDAGLTDPATREYFRRLAAAFSYHGSQLIAMPLSVFGWSFVGRIDPREAQGTPFAALLEPGYLDKRLVANQQRLALYRSAGLPVADYIGTAFAILRINPNLNIYNPQDTHWTPDGAKIGSEAVAAQLVEINPQLKAALNTKHFDVKAGTFAYFKNSGWPYAIRKSCPNTTWTPLSETIRTAESVALDPVGLLDDEAAPSVVVLGSSYSSPILGFVPYLQKDLGTEVTNAGQSGGGTFGAIRDYFALDAAQPWAKLYIWEFPDTFLFPDTEFRQVLPLLLPSTEIERGSFTAPGSSIAYTPKSSGIAGSRYVAEVAFDKPQTRELSLTLTYTDHAETVQLTKARGSIPTQFLIELSGTTPLKTVTATFPSAAQGSVHVAIRQYDEAAYEADTTGN